MYVIGVVFKCFENRKCISLRDNLLSLTSSAQPISLFKLLSIHKQSSSSNALLDDSTNGLTRFVFSITTKQEKNPFRIVIAAHYINISALNTLLRDVVDSYVANRNENSNVTTKLNW